MNAPDILKYGQSFLQRTLDGLPLTDWEQGGVCGVWSVKDIMAHLISYELMLIDVLNGFLGGGDTPTLTRMGELGSQNFNDAEVAARRSKTAQEVLAEMNASYDRVMALAKQIPAETWRQAGTLPWYGNEYSLDDYIVYTFYGHKREHGAQIAAFKDTLRAG